MPDQPLEQRHRTYSEQAQDHILNGETAEGITVFPMNNTGATPLFGVNLSIGWADTVVAADLYEHDAKGIACALAAALDCTADLG